MGKVPRKEKTFANLNDFLASKPAERSRPQLQRPSELDTELAQLVLMFPDIDREYARMCLQNYSQDRVGRVAEKILDRNFSNYPKHVCPIYCES